jgi:hypothetical protein
MTNAYCETLGIEVPVLDRVVGTRMVSGGEPTMFSLLVVALLERGAPMTLAEVAERLEAAGVAPAPHALRALKKSRPARDPVYRDGDRYGLDPHSDELDLLAFQLGLRPPRWEPLPPPPARPRPSPDHPLTIDELDEGWRDANLLSWSHQRVALAVLDAHGAAMTVEDIVQFVAARTQWCTLRATGEWFGRRGAALRVREDGRLEVERGRAELVAARKAVRDRVEMVRRYARPDPALLAERRRAEEVRRQEHAAQLGELSRAILHAFPAGEPRAAVLVDVDSREATTFVGAELTGLTSRLDACDVLAGDGIRPLLRALRFDPGGRRLADLAPPRKTITLNRRGRALRITTALLVQGSCGISRPFGDPDKLAGYLAAGQLTKLRRRLEADARSLFALYQYGRTHGAVRVRWGLVDEMLAAPWVHRDESTLYHLKQKARDLRVAIEVVIGGAPGLDDPWARARRTYIAPRHSPHDLVLLDEEGFPIEERDVQLARLAATIH